MKSRGANGPLRPSLVRGCSVYAGPQCCPAPRSTAPSGEFGPPSRMRLVPVWELTAAAAPNSRPGGAPLQYGSLPRRGGSLRPARGFSGACTVGHGRPPGHRVNGRTPIKPQRGLCATGQARVVRPLLPRRQNACRSGPAPFRRQYGPAARPAARLLPAERRAARPRPRSCRRP